MGNSWTSGGLYHTLFIGPLFMFSLFGILGVLVDADHLIAGWERQTMVPILIVCWLLCIGSGAYTYRLVHRGGVDE